MFGFLKSSPEAQRAIEVNEEWPSIVFLLREPVLPSAEQAIEMAKAAWGAAGPVEFLGAFGTHNFAIRIAPLTFAMQAVARRYEVSIGNVSVEQQQSWDEHEAWLAVDLPGKKASALRANGQLAGAYKALMYFPIQTLVSELSGPLLSG